MDVSQALVTMIKESLHEKVFSTGSKGFFGNGKITIDGVRFQAQAQAILIGSKDDPSMVAGAPVDEISAALTGLVVDGLCARRFSTGRTGYRTDGKVEAHGQRYQASVQAVRLS